ncbi:cwf21 domain-containing protein [Dipodascopsis uninucleata]
MSYNNIGLSTPRGSGTNGYVTRNVAHTYNRDQVPYSKKSYDRGHDDDFEVQRAPAKEILDHDEKRKIELKCIELRDELEDEGVDEEEIEKRVEYLRHSLLKRKLDKRNRASEQRREPDRRPEYERRREFDHRREPDRSRKSDHRREPDQKRSDNELAGERKNGRERSYSRSRSRSPDPSYSRDSD